MSKQRTYPNNEPESSAPQPGEEEALAPSASVSPAHQAEAEEVNELDVDDPITQEEREASEALMESYNG